MYVCMLNATMISIQDHDQSEKTSTFHKRNELVLVIGINVTLFTDKYIETSMH